MECNVEYTLKQFTDSLRAVSGFLQRDEEEFKPKDYVIINRSIIIRIAGNMGTEIIMCGVLDSIADKYVFHARSTVFKSTVNFAIIAGDYARDRHEPTKDYLVQLKTLCFPNGKIMISAPECL